MIRKGLSLFDHLLTRTNVLAMETTTRMTHVARNSSKWQLQWLCRFLKMTS